MDAFATLTSVAAPLPQDDVDTDIIYPARFLLITDRDGLERYGFHDWRFDAHGAARPGFPLDDPRWRGAAILVAGANFGCGSSREQAPWALLAMGVRCVIAPSFGEIFLNNCFRNGVLPIVLGAADHARVMAEAEAARPVTIDLAAGAIRLGDGGAIGFAVDPRRRDALLAGLDEIDGIVAAHGADIARFEAAQRAAQPWLWTHDEIIQEETAHG